MRLNTEKQRLKGGQLTVFLVLKVTFFVLQQMHLLILWICLLSY